MRKTLLGLLLLTAVATAQEPGQKTFPSAEEAAKAMVAACAASDVPAILELVGPSAHSLVESGNAVQDANNRAMFVKASQDLMKLVPQGDTRMLLAVGKEAFPFPVPIVKKGNSWFFDGKLGQQELKARRVGRNELLVLRAIREYVKAQREYAAMDPDKSGMYRYAQRFLSQEGRHDGLYWPGGTSPLGPLFADAGAGKPAAAKAFHGYHFKILTRQGASAPGGAYDYLVNGNLVGGFGLVAWPANYGYSGVMTFIVGPGGVVYERDLKGEAVDSFNPGKGWRKI